VLDTAPEDLAPEAFETAVSYAASLALVLLHRAFRVGLLAGGAAVPPAVGHVQAGNILRCLALVESTASGGSEPPPWLGQGSTLLTVTPAPGRPRIEVAVAKNARRSA
jgi:uncharacterized protein (DUF58 family)